MVINRTYISLDLGWKSVSSTLVILSLISFSTRFQQSFYYPKLLAFFAAALMATVLLLRVKQWRVPGRGQPWYLAALALWGLVTIPGAITPYSAAMHWIFLVAALLLYLACLQLSPRRITWLFHVVILTALSQVPVVVLQWLSLDSWLPQALCCSARRPGAMVGNTEFLSVLLAAAFFLLRHRRADYGRGYWPLCLMFIVTLVILKNKSALLFIFLAVAYGYFPRGRVWFSPQWKLIGAAIVAVLLPLILWFPDSIYGRLLLWKVAASIFMDHPFTGVGLRQFADHYMTHVHQLFQAQPWLARHWGGYAANTLDAHNLPLHMAAEMGLAGLLLALLLMVHMWRISRQAMRDGKVALGMLGMFLVYKSLFTVVLSAVSGMLITVMVMAAMERTSCIKAKHFSSRPPPWLRLGITAVMMMAMVPVIRWARADLLYKQAMKASLLTPVVSISGYREVVRLKPDFASAYLELAYLDLRNADLRGVQRNLMTGLRYGANVNTVKIAAHIYMKAGLDEQALAYYRYVHESYPQQLTPVVNMARIHMRQGHYRLAAQYAETVLQLRPRIRSVSYRRNRAIAADILRRLHGVNAVAVPTAGPMKIGDCC